MIRLLFVFAVVLICWLPGCQTLTKKNDGPVPEPQVGSRFVDHHAAPGIIQRVVLLPIECPPHARHSLKHLPEALTSQIRNSGRFEIVDASQITDFVCPVEAVVSGTIPEQILIDAYYQYDADAVIVVRVNEYLAYQPMSIGLTLHLIDTREGISRFSVDEYWSMKDPGTAHAFHLYVEGIVGDPVKQNALLGSPTVFANFVASRLFDVHPEPQMAEGQGTPPSKKILRPTFRGRSFGRFRSFYR